MSKMYNVKFGQNSPQIKRFRGVVNGINSKIKDSKVQLDYEEFPDGQAFVIWRTGNVEVAALDLYGNGNQIRLDKLFDLDPRNGCVQCARDSNLSAFDLTGARMKLGRAVYGKIEDFLVKSLGNPESEYPGSYKFSLDSQGATRS